MKLPEEPLVSIIMNCFNGEKYLSASLESVLTQSFQNWELIFWDNQSTDRSAEIFNNYGDKRFKYFYAPKHSLLYKARNEAIEKASGEFYAFLDVDDWWDPEKLRKQIPLFNDSEVGIVYGNYWLENELKGTRKIAFKKKLPSGLILHKLLKKYVVGLVTVVFRRKSFESLINPFNPQYHIIGDFDCVIRMAVKWKLDCVQDPLAHYRWHGENETIKHTELMILELEKWKAEMYEHPVVSATKKFETEIHKKILYYKILFMINKRKYFIAFNLFTQFPTSKMKIQLLVKSILKIIF